VLRAWGENEKNVRLCCSSICSIPCLEANTQVGYIHFFHPMLLHFLLPIQLMIYCLYMAQVKPFLAQGEIVDLKHIVTPSKDKISGNCRVVANSRTETSIYSFHRYQHSHFKPSLCCAGHIL